jgi:putative transposase
MMPNTYTQVYIQFVFAVKYRRAMLATAWDDRLRRYITAVTQNNGHTMLAINNMSDHLHMLVGFNPTQSLSELMKQVKGESAEWINREKLTPEKFRWLEGFGAFSYSRSHLPNVIAYIENQQIHHQRQTFLTEYRELLEKFNVDFDDRYIFRQPED